MLRQRAEWDTRSAMNARYLHDTMTAGEKQITPEMLQRHPTQGANPMKSSASRQDVRGFHTTFSVSYFPDAPAPKNGEAQQRPTLPPRSLFSNPWFSAHGNGFDVEGGDVIRELRGAVKESNRFLTQDAGARLLARTFR